MLRDRLVWRKITSFAVLTVDNVWVSSEYARTCFFFFFFIGSHEGDWLFAYIVYISSYARLISNDQSDQNDEKYYRG